MISHRKRGEKMVGAAVFTLSLIGTMVAIIMDNGKENTL